MAIHGHTFSLLTLSPIWFAVVLLPTLLAPIQILGNDQRPYLAVLALPLAIAWCAILRIGSWERHGNWVFERPLGTDAVTKGLVMAESPYNLGHAHTSTTTSSVRATPTRRSVRLSPDHARAPSNLGPCTVRQANT